MAYLNRQVSAEDDHRKVVDDHGRTQRERRFGPHQRRSDASDEHEVDDGQHDGRKRIFEQKPVRQTRIAHLPKRVVHQMHSTRQQGRIVHFEGESQVSSERESVFERHED
jgi:hypothetical protein